MLEMHKGSKRITNKYFSLDILKDINLRITTGELIAITGPSGSGKTTLLNMIGGLDSLTEGSYLYQGENIVKMSDTKRAKYRNQTIGFIVQNFALLSDYSVFENVELPLKFSKMKKRARKKRVLQLLDELGIKNQKEKMIYELSGGQQQRVAIARALANKPMLILADEPTGALDVETGQAVIELLHEINATGVSVIIVTHDEGIAKQCHRRIYLEDGRIVKDIVCQEECT